jgi:hypothetical protein
MQTKQVYVHYKKKSDPEVWFPLLDPFPELAFIEDADLLAAYSKNRFLGLGVEAEYT